MTTKKFTITLPIVVAKRFAVMMNGSSCDAAISSYLEKVNTPNKRSSFCLPKKVNTPKLAK